MLSTQTLPENYDVIAPDGSEIRLLCDVKAGGMCHCTLPPGGATKAVTHRTVEEIWFCVSGVGEIWRKMGDEETVTELRHGVSVTIPLGTHFQFHTVGAEPLCVVIATMPPWPGEHEAVPVPDYWPPSLASHLATDSHAVFPL